MNLKYFLRCAVALVGSVVCAANSANALTGYNLINLVSDIPGVANVTDPNLQNPWGMAFLPTSPIWVADNKTGVSTLYNGSGTPVSLVVTVPPPSGGNPPAAPTGIVANASSDFTLTGATNPARFIFATEDGTISGWNPTAAATQAILKVDNSAAGAVYKGLAIGNNGTANFLYATNFFAGTIDVFDTNFSPATLTGNFTDPGLPSGFAPFGIQNIGGLLFVTYAKQDVPKHDDVPGPGNGFVDKFDTNGNFLARFVTSGPLNSPWGLARAPITFGDLSGAMLVGNFGDGRINAFDAVTGAAIGTLNNSAGNPIAITGLWALLFGNGVGGGLTNELFFTAGIPGSGSVEDHGLFGKFIVAPPVVPALPIPALELPLAGLLGLLLAAAAFAMLRRRRRAQLPSGE